MLDVDAIEARFALDEVWRDDVHDLIAEVRLLRREPAAWQELMRQFCDPNDVESARAVIAAGGGLGRGIRVIGSSCDLHIECDACP